MADRSNWRGFLNGVTSSGSDLQLAAAVAALVTLAVAPPVDAAVALALLWSREWRGELHGVGDPEPADLDDLCRWTDELSSESSSSSSSSSSSLVLFSLSNSRLLLAPLMELVAVPEAEVAMALISCSCWYLTGLYWTSIVMELPHWCNTHAANWYVALRMLMPHTSNN